MKFKVGQVLNSRGTSFFMKLVRLRNKIRWGLDGFSHSSIIGEVLDDDVIVYEALSKGFVKNKYEKWWLEARIDEGTYIIGTANAKLTKVKTHCEKYLGTPYGWTDIWAIFKYWAFGRNALVDTDTRALICSEAVCRILYDASNKKIDFEEEWKVPYDEIEPMHIYLSKQITWNT